MTQWCEGGSAATRLANGDAAPAATSAMSSSAAAANSPTAAACGASHCAAGVIVPESPEPVPAASRCLLLSCAPQTVAACESASGDTRDRHTGNTVRRTYPVMTGVSGSVVR